MEHIAWPVITLLLGLTFMIMFKKNISNFLERTHKISKDGIHAGLPQVQTIDTKSSAEELLKELSSIAIQEQEDNIKKELDNRGFTNSQDKINFLIRYLAINLLSLHFERINAAIWGSQISILQHLNSRIDGDTVMILKSFYDNVYRMYPETFTNYSFEQYMQFLVTFNLIKQQGEQYFIANIGREFLVYIAATGQTKWRSF